MFNLLNMYCILLTLHRPSIPFPFNIYNYRRFPLNTGARYYHEYKINDVERLKFVISLFRKLPSKDQQRLIFAVKKVNDCLIKDDNKEKIIDLATAAECIFEINGFNLEFKLQVRAAWLLGNNKEERKSIMNVFKEIYDVRSKFIHGNIKGIIKQQNLKEIIERGIELVSNAIWKILELGKSPSWDELVIDASL